MVEVVVELVVDDVVEVVVEEVVVELVEEVVEEVVEELVEPGGACTPHAVTSIASNTEPTAASRRALSRGPACPNPIPTTCGPPFLRAGDRHGSLERLTQVRTARPATPSRHRACIRHPGSPPPHRPQWLGRVSHPSEVHWKQARYSGTRTRRGFPVSMRRLEHE